MSILRTCGLSVRYGKVTALDGINIELKPFEILGLLGPNGAGKSTLLHALAGIIPPDAGDVCWSGEPSLGYCPQSDMIWDDLTAAYQLQMMARLHGLSRAQARRRTEELLCFTGLESRGGCRGRQLSGGMRRLLSLAMALVHDPEVILLDEVEAGLDIINRCNLRKLIQKLAGQGRSIIVATHDVEEIEKLASRLILLDAGRVLVCERVSALLSEGNTTVSLDISSSSGDQVQMRLHRYLKNNAEIKAEQNGGEIKITTRDPMRTLAELHETLRGSGAGVQGVSVAPASLEDVVRGVLKEKGGG